MAPPTKGEVLETAIRLSEQREPGSAAAAVVPPQEPAGNGPEVNAPGGPAKSQAAAGPEAQLDVPLAPPRPLTNVQRIAANEARIRELEALQEKQQQSIRRGALRGPPGHCLAHAPPRTRRVRPRRPSKDPAADRAPSANQAASTPESGAPRVVLRWTSAISATIATASPEFATAPHFDLAFWPAVTG
jgi:hypothetical protein